MNLHDEFIKTVLYLQNKGDDIDKIKKYKMFNNIDKSWWLNFEKIKLRTNQEYVLQDLYKNGIKTGIHCQATGCGKSYIILMYCNYFKKQGIKGNIIIFTERVSILEDFFDLKMIKISEEKKNLWKNNNIINLDEFEIIERVKNKDKNWNSLLKNNNNTKILLINRAFLTKGDIYKDLDKNNVGMIIHDECHNTSSEFCYKMLSHFKKLHVPIIGFSATPLRTGKTSNEFNKDRLINIYGDENKNLIILSNFNMIYSIKEKLILPPNFIWYNLPSSIIKNNGKIKDDINKEECKTAIFSILNEVIPILPYKKIIAWCGTIKHAEEWYKIFNENKTKNMQFRNFVFCIDHSEINQKTFINNNYDEFRKQSNNAILFCANKHREGSDIPKLDCCIFIDFVKNRSPIPFIQSIGRVLRTDGEQKTYGYIIDSFVANSEYYERDLVEKIIGYYMSFENLNKKDLDINKYDKYLKIKNMTEFDIKEQKIILKLGNDNNINIDCKNLEWKNIIDKFDSILQNKIKLSAYDNLKSKAKILKNKFNFNINSDFITEYKNISEKDKKKYNLPNIDDEEYLIIFNKYTWFDILNIKHNFIELNELIRELEGRKMNSEKWIKLYEKNKNKNDLIPLYPHYAYNNFSFNLFNNNVQNLEM